MKETLILLRNWLDRFLYKAVFRPIFFRVDPETIHDQMIQSGRFFGSSLLTRKFIAFLFSYSHKCLEQRILGIKFSNPIGLAAGFDKDGVLTDILPSVGFGFAEVGSITGEPCEGNPRPRLWRLTKSKGLVVYYGLKNAGCERIAQRLKKKTFKIPIGINVAKTNSPKTVEIAGGINDYVKAYKKVADIGNYFAINISCPNAYGGQPFTDSKSLDALLDEIDKIPTKKPIFIKISPDLRREEIDQIIKVSREHHVNGFVCTNLTEDRKDMKLVDKSVPKIGGISGKPVENLANDLISYVYQKTKGEFVIIGCGGIFSARDAYKKIKLGASLAQLITGMVFEGPQVISEINQGLVSLLRKDGFENISEAVGIDNR
ncbi:MAG: dihydroorotate dehydrogenase (quinone) [Candidatus Woykebacteria bacterium GWB1_45_5]|uniref:Dihydroorotate dehydrogenase (quinone) n=2 Tax=Candidatus Woykeibacteriota TaxID=1817899 RepID=A0A1G1W0I8_9BACT|nr:MAG: dihydroorotate dehydrogenase (quinone) [Candidatus Woykebacteria bacterium GWA1_44_8]OGY24724.1 MAG: dihydroorotate dehydrogenase (quinone) [Candidatus Woykebacteria bacterium GWB1_45_5]